MQPRFLTIEAVHALHRRGLDLHGGQDGLRDPGLLQSALGSAENTYWYGNGDLFAIAAAYAFHIAEAQAFIDGNKRAAVSAAATFLEMHQIPLMGKPSEFALYTAMIDIASGRLDKDGLAELLRALADVD